MESSSIKRLKCRGGIAIVKLIGELRKRSGRSGQQQNAVLGGLLASVAAAALLLGAAAPAGAFPNGETVLAPPESTDEVLDTRGDSEGEGVVEPPSPETEADDSGAEAADPVSDVDPDQDDSTPADADAELNAEPNNGETKAEAALQPAEASNAAVKKAPFRDVPANHQFRDQIAWLAGTKITTGYADGTFKPGAQVSREAMAAFLERFDTGVTLPKPKYPQFTDVASSHKFYREISWLSATGVTTGYADGRFGPGASVERQAMAAFLYRAAGKPKFQTPTTARFSDVPRSHQFFHEVEWLASTGITTGFSNGTFRPGAPVERQAMAAFLQRFEQKFFGGVAKPASAQASKPIEIIRATGSALTAAWQQVPDARSYRLEWSRAEGGELPMSQPLDANTLSATISGLRPGLSYRVQIVAVGEATAAGVSAVTGTTGALQPLSVATFNVVASKQVGTPWIEWSSRRQKVWDLGNSRRPDVIGLQEAGNNTIDLKTGKQITVSPVVDELPRFYDDVVRGWKAKDGTRYQLVNNKAWNCVNHWSPAEPGKAKQRCTSTRKNVGASHDARIAYNPTTVKVIKSGAHQLPEPGNKPLPTTHGGTYEKYIAWAVFEQRSTGKQFFFANVHLDNARKALHASEIRKQLPKLNPQNLPVVLVGDFSTQQWESTYKTVIDPLKQAGYTDLLGSKYGTSDRAATGLGTAYVGRPNCNSANAFSKQYLMMGANSSLPKCAKKSYRDLGQNGANVDYIFTKGIKKAPVWESMLDMDNSGNVQGTPPSDHVMLRAEVLL